MPDVLARGDELRQHEGPLAEEAPQLEHAAPRRPEEQIVIEEAGIDGIAQEELVAMHVPIHDDDRNAGRIEHAGAGVGVVHLDLGLARHIAVDDEGV
jgi:hypothetical protein